jgi:hypothetical protein
MTSQGVSDGLKEHMMALVRKSEGGQVIYQERFGASWLSDVLQAQVDEKGFSVQLQPLRRVDTALWRDYKPRAAFEVAAPWEWIKAGKHVLTGWGVCAIRHHL